MKTSFFKIWLIEKHRLIYKFFPFIFQLENVETKNNLAKNKAYFILNQLFFFANILQMFNERNVHELANQTVSLLNIFVLL